MNSIFLKIDRNYQKKTLNKTHELFPILEWQSGWGSFGRSEHGQHQIVVFEQRAIRRLLQCLRHPQNVVA